MDKDFVNKSVETIETTLGELIEAVTQIALESGKSDDEAYKLASLTVEHILNRRRVSSSIN